MMVKIKYSKGFSLVELMVALTIFSIVMTVSIGTLLILIDANGKAQALSSATTNLTFAIDSMTRSIRTGKDYYCTSATNIDSSLPLSKNDCPYGSTAIVFTPGFESSWRMAYRLNGTSIEQWLDKPGVSDGWVPITSNTAPAAVNVSTLKFTVTGSTNTSGNDFAQPRISLFLAGSVDNGLSSSTPFEIQSNVTQRVLNY